MRVLKPSIISPKGDKSLPEHGLANQIPKCFPCWSLATSKKLHQKPINSACTSEAPD